MYPNLKPSASDFSTALLWLNTLITIRIAHPDKALSEPVPHFSSGTPMQWFVETFKPDNQELSLLLLAMAPVLQPDFYNRILTDALPEGGEFPEFGGIRGHYHRGIIPTIETALYVLAGDNLHHRFELLPLFEQDNRLVRKQIIRFDHPAAGEPSYSARMLLHEDWSTYLMTGKIIRPRFGNDFPAEFIETSMEPADLILHSTTRQQISEIEHWIRFNDHLIHFPGLHKRVKPGYRALFYGPPGTGKTLTATLLGKITGKEVYRIDLSRVISKYIGETEKNLSGLFDRAGDKDWILFFDEADALFGKRTDIRDAHDKYANQEVAYLLQRIEAFNGLVILATNQRGNIDEAFVRRFQAIIHFPMPGPDERAEMWKKTFSGPLKTDPDTDWNKLAASYELSGAAIVNAAHYCMIALLASGSNTLTQPMIENAIRREFVKEGKIV